MLHMTQPRVRFVQRCKRWERPALSGNRKERPSISAFPENRLPAHPNQRGQALRPRWRQQGENKGEPGLRKPTDQPTQLAHRPTNSLGQRTQGHGANTPSLLRQPGTALPTPGMGRRSVHPSTPSFSLSPSHEEKKALEGRAKPHVSWFRDLDRFKFSRGSFSVSLASRSERTETGATVDTQLVPAFP